MNKMSKSQDSEKNENKEDIFNQFNPFSQKIINALNINNLNIIPYTNSSNDKNSQKYINSEKNFLITPDKNSAINTNKKTENIANNKNIDNKNLNPFLVQNYVNNPYIKNNQLRESIISYLNDNSNTSNSIIGTTLIKAENSISNNKLPLYDDNTNDLNINNLNLMIENSDKQIDNNSNRNAVISTSINSNLDIIKEEQTESDKKSEQDLDANKHKINLSNHQNNLLNSIDNIEFISIEKLINEDNNKEEDLTMLINENYDKLNSSLENYNNFIINAIIETDINSFKNKIDEFINYSEKKINNLKILDDICDRIKNEIIIIYDIIGKIENNNINEYMKIKEYESKLDYIINIQSKLIEELTESNNQLRNNNHIKNKDVIMTDEELNRNIANANSNMDKLNDIINHIFIDRRKLLDFNNYKLNDINNFEDNNLFFEMLKNISMPLKDISNEYFGILLSIAELKNK
jgi:hypothetical protein